MNFSTRAKQLIADAEQSLKDAFVKVDDIAVYNQYKVLTAFKNNKIGTRHFAGTSGYGYDDIGRDTLAKVFAEIFEAEDAIVSPLISSGTQALTVALFGVLRPNDTLLSVTGTPYDTLQSVISGENVGSLTDFNVKYEEIALTVKDGASVIDTQAIAAAVAQKSYKAVLITRSRGYSLRGAMTTDDIAHAIEVVRKYSVNRNTVIITDNCYGEFVERVEPTGVGADIAVGSLIKNAGGGLAPTGGYIAGKKELIKQISYRLTAPALGCEVGSYEAGYRLFYQGVFLAPHVTANALKCSLLFGAVFNMLGFETIPDTNAPCGDIIRSIKFRTKEELIGFCRSVQSVSPIDSNVTPVPWDMPGYDSEVIMAAGAFVSGASIELSADSPIKEPYIAYLQGGLTYEHGKIAAMQIIDDLAL